MTAMPTSYSSHAYEADDAPRHAPQSGIFRVSKHTGSGPEELHDDAATALERLEAVYAPRHAHDEALELLARRYGIT
jgi:hypothetical protein